MNYCGIGGVNRCVKEISVSAGSVISLRVCSETRSYRWQSWEQRAVVGLDSEDWAEVSSVGTYLVCVCVCACVRRYGCLFRFPRSLIWRASIIRPVSLDPHLWYERVHWRQIPHSYCTVTPAHLDKQTWPFIISVVIPELPSTDFYLHYAQETGIHILNPNLFSPRWGDSKERKWGVWCWWWGVQGGGRILLLSIIILIQP